LIERITLLRALFKVGGRYRRKGKGRWGLKKEFEGEMFGGLGRFIITALTKKPLLSTSLSNCSN
jgi:hypothetical protein